jgi:hypothetical protein
MLPNTESEAYKRANIKWLVLVRNNDKVIDGVTLTVGPSGVFVSCAHPLKVNDTCEVGIKVENRSDPIHAIGAVVWSNIHGQDDYHTPRGMAIKFTRLTDKDRDFITAEAVRHLQRKGTGSRSGTGDGAVKQNAA